MKRIFVIACLACFSSFFSKASAKCPYAPEEMNKFYIE